MSEGDLKPGSAGSVQAQPDRGGQPQATSPVDAITRIERWLEGKGADAAMALRHLANAKVEVDRLHKIERTPRDPSRDFQGA